MKFIKFFTKFFIFLAGLTIALWFFMPWGKVGEYAVLSAEKIAADKGFNMQHASVDGDWRGPTININEFVSKMLLGGAGFKTLSVSPSIVASLLRVKPVISVSFTGGELFMPGGVVASLGAGSLELSFSNGQILMNNVKSDGELSLDGNIAVNLAESKIAHADLTIRSPEKLKNSLSSMKGFLPLNEESDGVWKLKRENNG